MKSALATPAEPALIAVDASVLVELVVSGRHKVGADALLDHYARSPGLSIVTAAHGLVEAISALRRLVLAKELSDPDGAAAVVWLCQLDLVLDATAPRASRVWSLRNRMTAYDAAHAATAEAFGVPLVTTDLRLFRACQQEGISAVSLDTLAATLAP